MTKIEYLPHDTRIYAIGDIHGGLTLLEKLMDVILAHEVLSPKKENLYLVFLGDYIDRGEHSKQVIDYLTTKLPPQFETIFLKGNHEDMMLNAIDFESRTIYRDFEHWFYNGGQNTISSYGVPIAHDFNELAEDFYQALSETHLAFFKNLPVKFELGHYFFCHAGIRPDRPLKDQTQKELLWIRDLFLNFTQDHEKIIVHGHTPEIAEHHGNRIGIDSGSVMSGKLTAVCLEDDGSHQLLSVNHKESWSN